MTTATASVASPGTALGDALDSPLRRSNRSRIQREHGLITNYVFRPPATSGRRRAAWNLDRRHAADPAIARAIIDTASRHGRHRRPPRRGVPQKNHEGLGLHDQDSVANLAKGVSWRESRPGPAPGTACA